MTKYLIIIGGLICSFGCSNKEFPLITIVDIGDLNRSGIAKELRTINQHSPKIVGLDFRFEADSLDSDIELVKELSATKSLVQGSHLLFSSRNYDSNTEDSLGTNHPKFKFGSHGFINLETTELHVDSLKANYVNSVLDKEGDENDALRRYLESKRYVLVRELRPRQTIGTESEYAFSYLVAIKHDSQRVNQKFKGANTRLTFSKKSFGHFFKIISPNDLLSGNFKTTDLTDKIVLMGYTGDIGEYLLDKTGRQSLSGVEVQACFIRAILD